MAPEAHQEQLLSLIARTRWELFMHVHMFGDNSTRDKIVRVEITSVITRGCSNCAHILHG